MHGTFLFCRKTSVAFSGFRLISFHFVSFHFLMFSSTITLLLDSMLFASLPVNLHVYLRLILMSRPNIFVKHAFRLSGGRPYTLQYCMPGLEKKKKFSFTSCWLLLNFIHRPKYLSCFSLHSFTEPLRLHS